MSGARSLANALLDLGLPTIKEWLRARLGPVADLEAVVTEGSLLHLDRVTIPIGPRGLLTLARATCALSRGARVGLPNVRLHAFEGGLLRFGGPGEPSFAADIAFTADANPGEDAWVAGRLVITNATWTVGASARDEHVPMSGGARLVVTSSKWSLEQGELRTDSAEVKFSGGGQLDSDGDNALERAHISLRDARTRHFVDAVTALTGAPLAVELPSAAGDPKLSGEGAWDARGLGGGEAPVGRCDARIEADLLSLAVRGTVSRTGTSSLVVDGKVEGDVCVARVLGALGLPESSWPEPDDVLRLELAVAGSPTRPSARGTARADAMSFRLGRPRFEPPLVARSIAFDLATDDERLTLSGGLAAGSATLTLRGDLPFAPALEKSLALTLESFDAPTIAALVRAGGLGDMIGLEGKDASSTFSIPIHTRASGDLEVRLGPDGNGPAIEGAVVFETPRSALELNPLRWSGGDTTGTRLRGALALADALVAGLFPSDVRPTEVGVVTGDLGISGAATDLVLDGRVAANRVEVAIASRPEVPPYAFETVSGRLRITRRSILYDDAAFSGYGGAFRLDGEAPFVADGSSAAAATPPTHEDRLRVRIDDADARFVEALGRLATGGLAVRRERRGQVRPKDEIWIPESARFSGELRLDAAMKLTADVALEHGETALIGKISLSPAPELRLDGSELRGRIAVADALVAGAFDTTMQPLPAETGTESAPRIEATLKGRIDDAVISGVVTAERVRLGLRASPKVPSFVLTDLSALFRIDRTKIVWHKLAARAYGGTVSSSGMVGYAAAFTGLRSTVEWGDVDAGEIPVDVTGRQLAGSFVRGRLAGRMRVERLGPDDRPVLGHGNVVLGAAEYPAVELASAMLRRYGLPPPASRGTKDLTLVIELQQAGWMFRDLDAKVSGCSATGHVAMGFDGGVDGQFVLGLDESYLSKSTLLTLPAAFTGRVEIPMRVVGWLPRPAVQADVAGAFGRVMSQNRVTSFIDEAVDDVYAVFRGRPAPRAADPVEDEPPLPHAHDPARGPVDEDALVRELIASGADWDEIEWRLDEIRKGGTRFRVE